MDGTKRFGETIIRKTRIRVTGLRSVFFVDRRKCFQDFYVTETRREDAQAAERNPAKPGDTGHGMLLHYGSMVIRKIRRRQVFRQYKLSPDGEQRRDTKSAELPTGLRGWRITEYTGPSALPDRTGGSSAVLDHIRSIRPERAAYSPNICRSS